VTGQYKNEVLHEAWAYKKKKLEREQSDRAKLVTRWERFRDNYNRVRKAYAELEGLRIAVHLSKMGTWEGTLAVMASCREIEIEPLPFAYPFLLGLEMVIPVPPPKELEKIRARRADLQKQMDAMVEEYNRLETEEKELLAFDVEALALLLGPPKGK